MSGPIRLEVGDWFCLRGGNGVRYAVVNVNESSKTYVAQADSFQGKDWPAYRWHFDGWYTPYPNETHLGIDWSNTSRSGSADQGEALDAFLTWEYENG